MKIGITGALGYVGALLCQELIKNGHQVVGIDNFHKNKVYYIDGLELLNIDIRNKEKLQNAFNDVDVIVHLAAITGVDACNESPKEAYEVNVNGTNNIWWIAKENQVGIILASSFAMYGNPKKFPITEKHKMNPISWYGQLKYISYKNIEMLANFYDLPSLVLVKSNVYGAYKIKDKVIMKPTVINKFVSSALNKQPIEVFKPGTQKRNFLHIKDAVNAYISAIKFIKKQKTGTFLINIGGKDSIKIIDIAKLIQNKCVEKLNYTPKIIIKDNPRENEVMVKNFDIDISKAKELLKYTPEHNIENEIIKMLSNV